MSSSYIPRISINTSIGKRDKLRQLIPWGMTNLLFDKVIDAVIEAAEKDRVEFLSGGLVEGFTIQVKKEKNK